MDRKSDALPGSLTRLTIPQSGPLKKRGDCLGVGCAISGKLQRACDLSNVLWCLRRYLNHEPDFANLNRGFESLELLNLHWNQGNALDQFSGLVVHPTIYRVTTSRNASSRTISYDPIWMKGTHRSGGTPKPRNFLTAESSAYATTSASMNSCLKTSS